MTLVAFAYALLVFETGSGRNPRPHAGRAGVVASVRFSRLGRLSPGPCPLLVAPLDIPGIVDLQIVARGGFAVVYRGRQPAFDRAVAVKVVTGQVDDDAVRRRFARECRTLGQLSDHPNIVAVHDAGELSTGEPYLVMSYLPDGSYQELLDRSGPMPWALAADVVGKVADALEAAHRAGIVHCDVKPANILRSRFGEPQLADFGIARLAADGGTTSMAAMTPDYGAPEVYSGAEPTPQRDIYALGATFSALVLGRPPFASTAPGDLLARINQVLHEAPPDLRPLGVPDPLCQVVERAMAKDPDSRYRSAAAFADELRRAAGDPTSSPTPPTRAVPTPPPPATLGVVSGAVPGPAAAGGSPGPGPAHAPTSPLAPTAPHAGLGGPPTSPPGGPPAPPAGRSARRGPLVALLGLLAVALVAAGLALVLRDDDGGLDTAGATANTASVATKSGGSSASTAERPSTPATTRRAPTTTAAAAPTTTAPATTAPATAAPTTTAPTTTAPTTTTTPTVVATVRRTCGASGAGDCFLTRRAAPSTTRAELGRHNEGTTIQIMCQTTGTAVSSSVLGASSDIWAGVVGGGFVANIYLDGPGLDPFAITLPRC